MGSQEDADGQGSRRQPSGYRTGCGAGERQPYGEAFHPHTGADKKRWREVLDRRFPGAVVGVLSCYDRVLVQGTLPGICFAGGMERYLRTHQILLKDYTQWAFLWPSR